MALDRFLCGERIAEIRLTFAIPEFVGDDRVVSFMVRPELLDRMDVLKLGSQWAWSCKIE
jgi:hypothetical protein